VAGPGADLDGIATLRRALEAEGALLRVIAPFGGQLVDGKTVEIVERTFATGRSVEFDAIIVADGAPKDGDFRALVMLQEAFRHLKAVGAWGDGVEVLSAAGIGTEAPGVLTGKNADAKLAAATVAALGMHRAWDRAPLVQASMVPPTV
jgi:catalase